MATRIAYAANERDEAHFDVYVQEVASGVRQRVFDGNNIVSVSGFRSDAAKLALLHDRGYGDMSLLLLDVAPGEAQRGRPTGQLAERALGERRTHAAGADRSRRQQLPATVPARSGNRRVTVVYEADGRDVEAWAISSDGALLATVENDRGYAVLRVGPLDGERPVVTGLPRGVVTDLAWSPDGSTLAFSAAAPTEPPSLWLWRDGAARVAWQPERRRCELRRSRAGGMAEFRRHAHSRLAGIAAQPEARSRLSRGRLGAWRPGRPDAAEFPA